MNQRKISSFFILLLLPLTILSCATYQSKTLEARAKLKTGQFTEAIERLKFLADTPGDDQLVYVLDYATALQINGEYKASAQAFQKADKLVDLNDYHSVTNIVGATLGGEEMIQYKGESYEKFLISTMNAINYLMMGDYDGGLVEARRINDKISKMKMDGREAYEFSPFARYLAALMWDSEKKYDDAYIEYEGAYKLDPNNPFLPADLVRSAKLARRDESYKKWKKELGDVGEDPSWYDRGMGELILIYQQGWGAEKRSRGGQYRFPSLSRVHNQTEFAALQIKGYEDQISHKVYDVDGVAIETLEKDFGALVARRVGGIAAKAVVADQIRQKSEILGSIAWVAMNVADRADLRQWSTLPSTIQVARVLLKPGKYKISIQGLSSSRTPTNDAMVEKEIRIQAGRKTFMNWRSLR